MFKVKMWFPEDRNDMWVQEYDSWEDAHEAGAEHIATGGCAEWIED